MQRDMLESRQQRDEELPKLTEELASYVPLTITMTTKELISFVALVHQHILSTCLCVNLFDKNEIATMRNSLKNCEWIHNNINEIYKREKQADWSSLRVQLNKFYSSVIPTFMSQVINFEKHLKGKIPRVHGMIQLDHFRKLIFPLQLCHLICRSMLCDVEMRAWRINKSDTLKQVCLANINQLLNLINHCESSFLLMKQEEDYQLYKNIQSRCKVAIDELNQKKSYEVKTEQESQKNQELKGQQNLTTTALTGHQSEKRSEVEINIAEITAKIATEKAKQKTLRAQLKKLETKKKSISNKLQVAQSVATSGLQNFKTEFARNKNKLTQEHAGLISKAEKKVQVNTQAILLLTKELNEEVKQLADMMQKYPNLQEEINQLAQEVTQQKISNEKIINAIETEQVEYENTKNDIANEEAKSAMLQQNIALCDSEIQARIIKDQIANLRSAIDSSKQQISEQSSQYNASASQIESLKATLTKQDEQQSSVNTKRQEILAEQQVNADRLAEQIRANQQLKQFLYQRDGQLQARQQRLFEIEAQLKARKTELTKYIQRVPVVQPQPPSELAIKSGLGYKCQMTVMQEQSMAHDSFYDILDILMTKYLPSYFRNPMVLIAGNIISDIIATEIRALRAKLFLDLFMKPKPTVELPSCVIIPVEEYFEPDYNGLKQMGIIMYPLPTSSENRYLYQVTNIKEDVVFFLRQERVSFARAAQDVLRAVIDKAVFTKDCVVVNINRSSYQQSSAEIWYRNENDLAARKTNELVLVNDLNGKNPMLSFSMIADLLQLDDKAEIPDSKRLREWTEQFWNIVEDDDVMLCKKHNALVPLLFDKKKLRALKIMHQHDILDPMILPDDPGLRLSAVEFDNLFRKLITLQRDCLRPIVKSPVDKKEESRQSAGYDATAEVLKRQYLSQVYGYLMFLYYAKTQSSALQEDKLNTILDKLKPIFNNGSLDREAVKKALLDAPLQLTVEAGLSVTVGMFNPSVPSSSNSMPTHSRLVSN